ncbi:MAG: ATP-binding protein, partial [Chloroflexota bacterium]|nr:ATP-binding protein [Chloroflexota bacterium]
HYTARLPLAAPQIEDEVALDVSEIIGVEQQLIRTGTISLAIVSLLSSLIGVMLARHIGRPLSDLATAASRFSQGDLTSPISSEAQVREVALLGQALEQARIDLRRTLVDLQREKAWIRHLLEAIVEGIVTLDEYGYITFWSKGAERITGWSHKEVLYRDIDNVFQPAEAEEPFTSLIPDDGDRRKITVRLANGEAAALSVTRAGLQPTEVESARMALVFRDVSDEEALHRLLGHFMANVTHEFRTPLSALAAAIELLLDQAPELSQEEVEELLLSLHLGILRLQTLVDNLLESASLETSRFRAFPRPTELGEIVAEASGTMQPLLEKYDQRLVVELPTPVPFVYADPRRTTQVLVNLLSNAAKYGTAGTDVTIAAEHRDGKVRVTVADRGPGISDAHRDGLFRRFVHFNTDGDASRYGSGLGLWVVKAIVEAQGGEAGVEERPGGGSIFWFTLLTAEEA